MKVRKYFVFESEFYRKIKAAAAVAGKTITKWITEAAESKLKGD